MKTKIYNPAIDGMRVVTILAVVAIHTTTRLLEASYFNLQKYSFTLFINQASRFAVPLFFMISGFVLELNYSFHENYLSYLKKRLSKIFLPYLFWSGIYYFFIYTKHTASFGTTLLYGAASYQLYFVPALLIFYIIFPLLHQNYKLITNKWILMILGIIQIILLYQTYNIKPLLLFYPLAIAVLNYYVFVLGMFFSHNLSFLQKIGKWKILIMIFAVIMAFVVFLQGKLLYLKTHNYLFFYSQWRPSVLLYTVLTAGLLYFFIDKLKILKNVIQILSRLSFFVFFIHVIILEFFWHDFGGGLFLKTPEVLLNILFFLVVAGASYFVAFFAHKIPFLSKLSG